MKITDLKFTAPFTMEQLVHYVNLLAADSEQELHIEASAHTPSQNVCEIFEERERDFKWTPLKAALLREIAEGFCKELPPIEQMYAFGTLCGMLNLPAESWPHLVLDLPRGHVQFFGIKVEGVKEGGMQAQILDPKDTGRDYVGSIWKKVGQDPEFWRNVRG